jgi:hypothetical protein
MSAGTYLAHLGFEHDVFISYSHIDNEPLYADAKKGWVDAFKSLLETLVKQHLGKHVSVWRDTEKVEGNEVFNDSIPHACQRSAVLVCIVSPGYLNSNWCAKECDVFLKSLAEQPRGSHPHRPPVLKVLLESCELPQPLKDMGEGYPFFDKTPDPPGWTVQFLPRPSGDPDYRFLHHTDRLARKVADLLRDIGRETAQLAPPAAAVPVYIAERTDDVQVERDTLVSGLGRDAAVEPREALPLDYESLKSRVPSNLLKCELSVHLLGRSYGKPVAGDQKNRSAAQLEYDLAVELGKPRIVWISPQARNPGSLPPRQQEFVQAIKHETGIQPPVELLEKEEFDELQSHVRERLEVIRKRGNGAPSPQATAPGPVVFVAGRADDLNRPEVSQILACCRKKGCDAFTTEMKADANKRDDAFIKQANGLIILYCSDDRTWLQERIWKARKAVERRRRNPLVAAVHDSPPPPADKPPTDQIFQVEGILVINARDGFHPTKLEPFFERIIRKPR